MSQLQGGGSPPQQHGGCLAQPGARWCFVTLPSKAQADEVSMDHGSMGSDLNTAAAGSPCLTPTLAATESSYLCCLSAVASCIFPELLQIPTRSGMGSWHFPHTMQHWTCCCAPQRDLPKAVLSRSSNQVLYWHQETMSSV